MANRHTEPEAIDFKHLPRLARNIELVFTWIELVLGLDALQNPARVDHKRGDLAALWRDALHAEDGGQRGFLRPQRHRLERAHLVGKLERRHGKVLPAQARQIGLGETDDLRALG